MPHDVMTRPVRLPSRLLQRTSNDDLTRWAGALHFAASTWRLADATRLLGLLAAIGDALAAEVERRQYVASHPHEYVPAGLDGLAVDLGDAGACLTRDDTRRFQWLLDGPPGGEYTGIGSMLPTGHPIKDLLALACNEACRRWSDSIDHGRNADQWIRDALN